MTLESKRFRSLSLQDAMILVAIAGASLAVCRWILLVKLHLPLLKAIEHVRSDGPRYLLQELGYESVYLTFYPILTFWSLSLLGLRFRSPRPRRSRLWRQPGFVASVTAVLIASVNGLAGSLHAIHDNGIIIIVGYFLCGEPLIWARCFLPPSNSELQVGAAIGVAWSMLALSGRWKAEPSWIDRAGRVVGCLWLLPNVILYLRHLLIE